MVETKNDNFVSMRINVNTYHRLDKLRMEKKQKNLAEIGKVGDADFDGIINDLLNKNNGGGKNRSTR